MCWRGRDGSDRGGSVRGCRGVGGDHGVPPAAWGIPGGVRGNGTRSKMRATLATAAAECGYLPSLGKGHPCPLSSSTVVTILGLAVEEELLSSAATELAHLQAVLDPKHVDNLVHAVAQGDGPQMIRDLIDMCDVLSKDSNVVGRQTAAERHVSSVVRGLAKEGDLVSAVDFFKKLKMRGRALSPLLYNCLLEA